ncbi:MAG: phosphatidate cytidylyltransferase [Clostridiales bacterium]|nr:phosphatidate cytidylyltransferase [Clostridiales bacterium]
MIIRILTAVIGLPFLVGLVWFGGVPLVLAAGVLSLIGMYEFYKAACGKIKEVHFIGFALELLFLIFLLKYNCGSEVFTAIFMSLPVFVAALMAYLTIRHNKCSINDITSALFGFLYVGCLLGLIPVIRQMNGGFYLIWYVFIFAFASDTGAYFVGVKFGKHRLAPVLSPKKSIEGAVGGLITSGIVSAVYYFAYSDSFTLSHGVLVFAFGVLGSVFAQMGDLAASAVKREAGIKDYGNVFPGHGGVLDRFDSVLFTSVCVFLLKIFAYWL